VGRAASVSISYQPSLTSPGKKRAASQVRTHVPRAVPWALVVAGPPFKASSRQGFHLAFATVLFFGIQNADSQAYLQIVVFWIWAGHQGPAFEQITHDSKVGSSEHTPEDARLVLSRLLTPGVLPEVPTCGPG
jgi:hypothetical protein